MKQTLLLLKEIKKLFPDTFYFIELDSDDNLIVDIFDNQLAISFRAKLNSEDILKNPIVLAKEIVFNMLSKRKAAEKNGEY